MSEQSQPLMPHQESLEPEPVTVSESLPEKVSLDSPFKDYIDLDCDTSGIFGTQDIDAAKQIISKMQP